MQIFTKLYKVVTRFLGTPVTVVAIEAPAVEPIVMAVEPASDCTVSSAIQPQPEKISFERLSGWKKYRFMTEALESMFTQERYSENNCFIGICSAFPFSDCEIPPDALTCEVVDVQSDTPVIFRGEVMRIKRSLGRMQDCLKTKGPFPSQFAKRFESIFSELITKVEIMEEAIKVLDELTKVTDECAVAYRHEEILIQQRKDPNTKPCKGKCRNKKGEQAETRPETEPQKD